MIGVCLLGVGRIAHLHILGYLTNTNAKIVALCDQNKKRAEQLAATLPHSVKIYTDLDAALKDPEIDMVEVLTPHRFHEEHVVKIAEAGIHVSCQKVPTLTLSSFDRMVRATSRANINFRVYENFRFHPPYQRAMELVNDGIVGEVNSIIYRMWGAEQPIGAWNVPLSAWKWRIAENQNYKSPTLFDDGYHKHSIISMFLGDFKEPITQVRTWSRRQRVSKVIKWDTPATVIYETKKSHKFGQWTATTTKKLPLKSDYYGSDEFLEIQGNQGIIFVYGCTGNMFANPHETGPGKPGVYWLNEKGHWESDTSMDSNWKYSFINCTNNFIEAILDDGITPQLNADLARYLLQIDLAVVKSLRSDANPITISSIVDGIQ
ncbi:MAG: Gfo/Idh/MocA family protein [Candidatus Kariarchaeaceae archaeon]|jgi:predicted dehydrogenase